MESSLSRIKLGNIVLTLFVLSLLSTIFNVWVRRMPFNSYYDEIIVLSLSVMCVVNNVHHRTKEFAVVFITLLAYLVYSLFMQINVRAATILDFVLFFKPFMSFFALAFIPIEISETGRRKLRVLFLFCGLYCWAILPQIETLYSNTAGYYPCCVLSACAYLFFSNREKRHYIVALLLMLPGVFSFRAKFYSQLIVYIYIAFFMRDKLRMNLRWGVILAILAALAIYVSYDKFSTYFFADVDDGVARNLFYTNARSVLRDYFPFGPGFGTYGSEAAARYYSPLYYKYGMASVWGLSPESYGNTGYNFLVDTFYPVLAQFGVVGIALFVWFWIRRLQDSQTLCFDEYRMFFFIFMFISIQDIGDNLFTGPLGVPFMMFLGLVIQQPDEMLESQYEEVS